MRYCTDEIQNDLTAFSGAMQRTVLLKDIEWRDLKQKWFASSAFLSYENASLLETIELKGPCECHSLEAFFLHWHVDCVGANAVRSRRKSQPHRQLTSFSKECGSTGPRAITANKISRVSHFSYN